MRYLYGIVFLAFLIVVGIFAVQNMQVLTVKFLGYSVTAPFAFMSVCIYVFGMLTGWTVVGFIRSSIHRVTTEPHSNQA